MTLLVRGGGCQKGIQAAVVTSIYDFRYRGCVKQSEKIWECLVERISYWRWVIVQETWSTVLLEFASWLWAEMDPANHECLTSQVVQGIWIVDCGCTPGKRYQRIRTCLTGEVESHFSPIRWQAPTMIYPEMVERRPYRISLRVEWAMLRVARGAVCVSKG